MTIECCSKKENEISSLIDFQMMRQGIEAETTIKIPKCDGQKRSTN